VREVGSGTLRMRPLVPERPVKRRAEEITRWIRVMWWIWCTIGPQISHITQIDHIENAGYRINIRQLLLV